MTTGTGTGTVYQRASDGRWVAAVRLLGGTRVVRYASSEREARAQLKALIGKEQRGTLAPPTRLTFEAWSVRWLEIVAASCRPSTLEDYDYDLRPLTARIGAVRLDRLTPVALASTFAEMQTAGLGAGRRTSSFRTLRICLRAAVRLGVLGASPLDGVEPPRVEQPERRYWTQEECQRFIAAAEASRSRYSPLLFFLLGTGMRRGEALALTWADIDVRERVVRVNKSLVFVANKPVLADVKTKAGRRTVTLPDLAMRALARLPRPIDADASVFLSASGGTPFPMRIIEALRTLCRAADVPVIPPHGLRHVHAALLVANGVAPHTVQRRLGHARVTTTMAVYAYALQPDGAAVAAFEQAVTPQDGAGLEAASGG